MACARSVPNRKRLWEPALVMIALALVVPLGRSAGGEVAKKGETQPLPAALEKATPTSLDDLKAIQRQVSKVLEKVLPCTVCVLVGGGSGSGVIISEDGYILTAGHVSGKAGQNVQVIFHDGRKAKGKTLGANRTIDSGLIQITDEGKWPFVEMGKSAELKKGQWCVATGHPGGPKVGRPPVVRVGRLLDHGKSLLRSDCTLVGGDSGGPLFDMQGRVIGIHSRISKEIDANIHVPVDTYRDTWDKLAKGEVWGGGFFGSRANEPYLGVQSDPEAKDCRIAEIVSGSPAEKGGLRVNDVVTKFGDKAVSNFDELATLIRGTRPGTEVTVEVRRGDETVSLRVTIGRRGR
jgi:serine protease Do